MKEINHDTYRTIKGKNKKQLSLWLIQYAAANYNDGVKDNTICIFRRLIDDFGFSQDMIDRLQQGKDTDVDAINERYVSADELINGFNGLGYNIKIKEGM